jgi:ATP-dependent RNA helicase RhlE
MSSAQLGPVSERPFSPAQPVPATVQSAPTAVPSTSSVAFDQLGLTPDLLRTVAAQGYTEPTPVQAQSIPIVLAGRDLLAGAQTGTGKTAAFVLPILQLLDANRPAVRYLPGGKGKRGATGLPIRCLVLTPTRELALQIEESVRTYGAERPIRSTTIYGGVGFQPQVRALRDGPEIVVATPGRLLDHSGQGTIDLSSIEILVLDEADRMLDMGFIRDIRRILALLPARRQNLLFSATFSDEIRELAAGLLHDPAYVQIARRNAVIELVRQVVYPVDRDRKRELLSHLIRGGRIDRALVFTRTKHGANRLAEQLGQDGISASAIHGNKSQGQRVRALDDFKAGRVAILVATEVASRGLDIDGLPHVVNFELPTVPQDYVHRIGRTGRAGMEGDAVSLVCIDETTLLDDIQSLLRGPIRREVVPGFEVDRSIKREPIRQRSGDIRPFAGRRAPARQAAPVRQAALTAPRQPALTAPRQAPSGQRQSVAPGGFRRPIPSEFRQASQRDPRRPAPAGFNTSAPVEPRHTPPGGFRRPEPSDFRPAPSGGFRRPAAAGTSIGYEPARRPASHSASPNRAGYGAQPSRGAANRTPAGRPGNGGYSGPMPNARPMTNARSGERNAPHASMPGERIARSGNRTD